MRDTKLVMPGLSSLPCADCVNWSAMPGIHVLTVFTVLKQERRGWPGRARPWRKGGSKQAGADASI